MGDYLKAIDKKYFLESKKIIDEFLQFFNNKPSELQKITNELKKMI